MSIMFKKLLSCVVVCGSLLVSGCQCVSDAIDSKYESYTENDLTYDKAYEKFDELYAKSLENPNTSISNFAFMSTFLNNTFTTFNNDEWDTEKDENLVYEVASDWFDEHAYEIYQDTTHGILHPDDIAFILETLNSIEAYNKGELKDDYFKVTTAKLQIGELGSIYMDSYSEKYNELNN